MMIIIQAIFTPLRPAKATTEMISISKKSEKYQPNHEECPQRFCKKPVIMMTSQTDIDRNNTRIS